MNLRPFNGFRGEHFDFFEPGARRSWETKEQIERGLRRLWAAIREPLTREGFELGTIHVNPIEPDDPNAAAQANWHEDEKMRRKETNVSIELTSSELQVNLVGWTVEQARKLEAWLAPGGTVRSTGVLDEYELVVFRRHPSNYARRGQGSQPSFRREATPEQAARQPLSAIRGQRLQTLRAQWHSEPDDAWEKLAYHVRRAWPRAQVVEQGAALIEEMVKSVRELMPVVREINRGR